MRIRNPNRPCVVAIGRMPLPRPRKLGPGPRRFTVQLEGGPFHGQIVKTRAASTILPVRVSNGIYLPSGKFSAYGSAA